MAELLQLETFSQQGSVVRLKGVETPRHMPTRGGGGEGKPMLSQLEQGSMPQRDMTSA